MKALVIENPGQLVVRDIPEPEIGEYDVRCKMLYGATCTGTDLSIIDGRFPFPVSYPSVIGHESIGRVIETGQCVRNFKIGDLITRVGTRATGSISVNWGGMCEYGMACDHEAMRQDGKDKSLWDSYRVNQVIPDGLIDSMDATMTITWRENLSYIQRIGATKGMRVLVSGSGANGISLAAMAVFRGAEDVVMVGSSTREESARKTGISEYIDYRRKEAVNYFIGQYPGYFDIIIDATGKRDSLNTYMGCLKNNGTIGVYGIDDYHTYRINPLLAGSFRFYNEGYDEPETHAEVMELIRAGKLNAGIYLDRENIFDWANAPEAYAHVREKKAIKSVIKLF